MRRWVIAILIAILFIVVVGVIVTVLPKVHDKSNLVRCQHNLREISLFAAHHIKPVPNAPEGKLPNAIPAGTILLANAAPDERLSWVVDVLPGLDQKRQDSALILAAIDRTASWRAEANHQAAKLRVVTFLCPGKPPELIAGQPAPTQYVGIAGLGADAATLALPPPPAPAPPRAGCFRYDTPTPFDAIADGLSQTLLLGERSNDLGPWLRGGPSTVRGLDDGAGALPLLGDGGQFGGNHNRGDNWGFADGSVRFFTTRTEPRVLFKLATIAGQETDAFQE